MELGGKDFQTQKNRRRNGNEFRGVKWVLLFFSPPAPPRFLVLTLVVIDGQITRGERGETERRKYSRHFRARRTHAWVSKKKTLVAKL